MAWAELLPVHLGLSSVTICSDSEVALAQVLSLRACSHLRHQHAILQSISQDFVGFRFGGEARVGALGPPTRRPRVQNELRAPGIMGQGQGEGLGKMAVLLQYSCAPLLQTQGRVHRKEGSIMV